MQKLRVAVAGAGYFSQFHYEAWNRLGNVKLVGLSALEGAKAAAQRWCVPAAFEDTGEMLDAVEPDLLDIITPPSSHLEQVRLAAERGIAVICQKPLAANLAEAEAIVETAEAADVLLVVHENFRFMPWFREAKRLLVAGRLGHVHGVSFRLRPGDGQGDRAYLDRQPYFQKMGRFLIHETGIHFVDCFRYLLGEVTAVTARLRRINPVIAGEDAGLVLFEFASGASGVFDGNRLNDHEAENCRLTMGEMHLEGAGGVLRLDGDGRLFFKPHGEGEQRHPYDLPQAGFGGDCVYALQRHVVEHLTRGTSVMNRGRDYLANLRIEDAIYRSHETGQRVVLA